MKYAPLFATELGECFKSIRAKLGFPVTNFYILPSEWANWLRRRVVWLAETDDAILWMREEDQVWRVFYYGDFGGISAALLEPIDGGGKPVVVDILGRTEEVGIWSASLTSPKVWSIERYVLCR